MTQFRYSVTSLLLGVMNIVMLVSSLSTLGTGKSAEVVARGGLSVCTLFFSLLCGLMGRSASQTLLLSVTFYAWGLTCLQLEESCELNSMERCSLAVLGVSYATWAWLTPIRIRSREAVNARDTLMNR